MLSGVIIAILMISFVTFNTISAQETVPSWIKTTVGFWIDGKVDDNTFLSAVQFLANEGIIKVNAESTLTPVAEIYVKQKSVFMTAGLTSSANGVSDKIFCDGNDIAISGGASTSWGRIYINQLYPIVKNGVVNGYAVGFWNENPDSRTGQSIYITCLSTGDSSNANIKSYFKKAEPSSQEETQLKSFMNIKPRCTSSQYQLIQYEMNATYRHFADKNANGVYCQYYSASNDQMLYFDDKK